MSFQETETQSVRMSGADYDAMRNEILALREQRDELVNVLKEMIAISDRDHDVWNRAKSIIAKV